MTGSIWPQTDDSITEADLGKAIALAHHSNYVDRGIGLTPDHQNNVVDIGGGHAIIRSGNDARHVYPSAETGLALPVSSGVNYIYLVADFSDTTNGGVFFEANSSDAPTQTPALKIGEVDTSADTKTEVNRTAPLDTANLDAATLGGNSPSYYAPQNSPTLTGTPAISGVASTFQIGLTDQGGPHRLLFGNQSGENQGFVGFRTNPNNITIENDDTGTTIAKFPIDGSTKPTVLGETIQTIKSGTTHAVVYVGSSAPSNPEDGDVWIDTSQ